MTYSIMFNNREIARLTTIALIVIGVVWVINKYVKGYEYMEDEIEAQQAPELEIQGPQPSIDNMVPEAPLPQISGDSEEIKPEDLLPKSADAAQFEAKFPEGDKDLTKNFLVAGYHTGINTVSSSLRNASLQLRSDPYIEPKQVSPFLQSTILPDTSRKQMEIGTASC